MCSFPALHERLPAHLWVGPHSGECGEGRFTRHVGIKNGGAGGVSAVFHLWKAPPVSALWRRLLCVRQVYHRGRPQRLCFLWWIGRWHEAVCDRLSVTSCLSSDTGNAGGAVATRADGTGCCLRWFGRTRSFETFGDAHLQTQQVPAPRVSTPGGQTGQGRSPPSPAVPSPRRADTTGRSKHTERTAAHAHPLFTTTASGKTNAANAAIHTSDERPRHRNQIKKPYLIENRRRKKHHKAGVRHPGVPDPCLLCLSMRVPPVAITGTRRIIAFRVTRTASRAGLGAVYRGIRTPT